MVTLILVFCTAPEAMVTSRTELLPRAMSGSVVFLQGTVLIMSLYRFKTMDHRTYAFSSLRAMLRWPGLSLALG